MASHNETSHHFLQQLVGLSFTLTFVFILQTFIQMLYTCQNLTFQL